MDEKWPVEFGFIVGSRYVQVYPLGNSTCVHTCKLFSFSKSLENIFVCLHVFDRFHQVFTPIIFNHFILLD